MDSAFLEQLGLTVRHEGGVVEADLELLGGQAINPLTRRPINRVSFTVMGDRLLYVNPPELLGGQPISLAYLNGSTRLEDLVVRALTEHLFQLERRSRELTALGISARVDPEMLLLSAEFERPPLRLVISANRTGQFRIARAFLLGTELTGGPAHVFELSEFPTRHALEDYCFSLFSDVARAHGAAEQRAGRGDAGLLFSDLYFAFGDALVPPRAPLEVMADVRVGAQELRFSASRVQGQSFRGMLSGPSGKIWADRFDLSEFPSIRAFVAELMQVPLEEVEVVKA